MKIQKSNPLHWLYLAWVSMLCLIFIPFRKLNTKISNNIFILYGHKLHGNLNSIYENSRISEDNPKSQQVFFLTLDPRYYLKIKSNKNILLALNPIDLFKVVMSDCVISDHGLHSLILLLKLTNIRFVDVWHGIPFKGFIPDDFSVQHQYDEIWVSSKVVKNLYINKFGFKPHQVFVTGYGRTDLLLHYNSQINKIKSNLGIPEDKKVVLFAPTWKQDNQQRNEIPFNASQEEFFNQLQASTAKNDAFLIVRFHLNTEQQQNMGNTDVLHLPLKDYPNSEEIIAISDVLITDWSSIAFDMMALNNPIIFLEVTPPFKNGFSLPPEYRVGDIVKNLDELNVSLDEALGNQERYFAKYQERYLEVKSFVYDDTVDGRTTERYRDRMRNLLT